MKKMFRILLTVLIMITLIPVNKINAEESDLHISEEFAAKLSTYITTPNDAEEFALMDDDEIIVYIDHYKITRGDMILLEDGNYAIDVTKITEDDYEGPSRNARAVTVTYQALGSNSNTGAVYKSATVFYKSTYATGYTQTTKRRYSTRNQIVNYFIEYPSTASAQAAAESLWNIISAGIPSIPSDYVSLIQDVSDFTEAWTSLTKRNAFRTYAAGGNGGYLDETKTSAGTTRGYGVWNQTTIEHRYDSGSSSGLAVTTTIVKSTAG